MVEEKEYRVVIHNRENPTYSLSLPSQWGVGTVREEVDPNKITSPLRCSCIKLIPLSPDLRWTT